MYAGTGQQGAVNGRARSGWVVTNNSIYRNHGAGIVVGSGAQVQSNYVSNNGQIGISGTGDNLAVEYNQIHHNNTAHYYPLWEAGGAKFTEHQQPRRARELLPLERRDGSGTDENNINTLNEGNTCNDNTWMGIVHEISYAAVIRNNTILRNSFGYPHWIAAAGILVSASSDVEVYGNYLDGNAGGIGGMQQNRGNGAYGPHLLQNFWVHDNTIMNWAGWTGIAQDVGDNAVFTSRNNRFEHNTYKLNSKALPFTWMNLELNEFQSAGPLRNGHDRNHLPLESERGAVPEHGHTPRPSQMSSLPARRPGACANVRAATGIGSRSRSGGETALLRWLRYT